jgi:hypothetical protein
MYFYGAALKAAAPLGINLKRDSPEKTVNGQKYNKKIT